MPGIHGTLNTRGKISGSGAGMGERAYAYAKACGIIGKSFVGKQRIGGLKKIDRLSELDRALFLADSRNLPEKELLQDLEGRIIGRAVDSIISIVDCFSKPPEFLTLLVRGYEYADLTAAVAASMEGAASAPPHTDIGRFQTVRFDAWPDLRAMLEGTEFDFLLDKKGVPYNNLGGIALQTVIDRHYYFTLWKALFAMPARERQATERILADEISLRNSGWALRLRSYYGMPPDEVKFHLVYVPAKGGRRETIPAAGEGVFPVEESGAEQAKKKKAGFFKHSPKVDGEKKFSLYKSRSRSLADEAVASLEFPLDNFAAWSSWRWKEFLNPAESGESSWRADPRYFQNAASRYLSGLARHYFRLNPFSLDTIFCFIKLKQFEEDILTSNAEGLSMGMSGEDVFSMLGVEA